MQETSPTQEKQRHLNELETFITRWLDENVHFYFPISRSITIKMPFEVGRLKNKEKQTNEIISTQWERVLFHLWSQAQQNAFIASKFCNINLEQNFLDRRNRAFCSSIGGYKKDFQPLWAHLHYFEKEDKNRPTTPTCNKVNSS